MNSIGLKISPGVWSCPINAINPSKASFISVKHRRCSPSLCTVVARVGMRAEDVDVVGCQHATNFREVTIRGSDTCCRYVGLKKTNYRQFSIFAPNIRMSTFGTVIFDHIPMVQILQDGVKAIVIDNSLNTILKNLTHWFCFVADGWYFAGLSRCR